MKLAIEIDTSGPSFEGQSLRRQVRLVCERATAAALSTMPHDCKLTVPCGCNGTPTELLDSNGNACGSVRWKK